MTAPLNLEEGQSIYHPPKFDGKCYWWWKSRIHDFIMAEDCELWDIICDGPFVPIKTSGEYTEADKKALKKNARAKKILVYNLEPNEYDRISTCDTTKEICEALQIAYDRTTQVKQDKSNADDSSKMAVEGEETRYDSMLALMGQSDNGNEEDRDSLFLELEESEHTRKDLVAVITDQKNAIVTLRKEKSDLLAEVADQREQIVEPSTKSKPENPKRGKEIVSEEYVRLEDEVKSLRCRMSAEIEKNELLQANLEKVMNDLEKSLKWTWSVEGTTALFTNNSEKGWGVGFSRKKDPYNPHSKSATASDNWPRTQCGNTGHPKKGVQAKNQSGTVKENGQQWFMDSGCSKYMTGNTTHFLSLKALPSGQRYKNIYVADFKSLQSGDLSCLKAVDDDAELWHRRLGHASFSLLNKLIQKDLVHGLPMSQLKTQKVCDACARGKHVKSSFKSKRDVSTSKPLELLNMYLCGPMRVQNRGGKRYIFVIVDDYSRFTRTLFLRKKDEMAEVFVAFVKKILVKMESRVVCIRSDHGTEFDNVKFDDFCNENGISHNFSAPRTPQQNGVVEKKNRTLEEMARTMLIDSGLAKNFWAEAVNIACYLVNRCMIRSILNKTPYELLNGRKPKLTYLRTFGCKCYVLNNGKNQLESIHVIFDESHPSFEKNAEKDQDGEPLLVPGEVINMTNGKADMMSQMKEANGDNTASSSTELSTSIITTKAEERVVDAVQGTPLASERRIEENQPNIPSSSQNEPQSSN
ncbi:uncharacterized protein [Nicotiana sylvestris]|uniref:uncharacterized protein n=1 Tax=Nicotiana sylvestris TaxID=4096 RepID=UPI00388C8D23